MKRERRRIEDEDDPDDDEDDDRMTMETGLKKSVQMLVPMI